MLKIFDTHTHYDDEAYDNDRDEVIRRVLDLCGGFIAIGCSLKRSAKAIALANEYDGVYASVGIHPGDIEDLPGDYITQLEALAGDKNVVAFGEIGLDYHYPGYDAARQKQVFIEQLALADKLNLPVIVHSRDAAKDTLDILQTLPQSRRERMVMHCYSYSVETAKILLEMGLMLSFTGSCTFKNAKKAPAVLAATPLNRLMLETDCPYMAPDPFRGKRCDSGMLDRIAAHIAEVKGETPQAVIEAGNANAKRFFGIEF
jgi:TatD DNase family protein